MNIKKLYFILLIITSFYLMSCSNSSINKNPKSVEKIKDIDGNVYHTIIIGKQVWLVENLKVNHYRNGDPIPNIKDSVEWINLKTGAYCDYNNNSFNNSAYGRLYNFFAIKDNRKLCPKGWHIPSYEEWVSLSSYLSNFGVDAYQLKESGNSHWPAPNIKATNKSGFTALPGGYRNCFNNFFSIGYSGYWWCSTENLASQEAWCFCLFNGYGALCSFYKVKTSGISIRCIKDL